MMMPLLANILLVTLLNEPVMPITLQVGESHVLASNDVEEVVITQPGIVGYQQLPSGVVVITAQQPGQVEVFTFSAGHLQQTLNFAVQAQLNTHLKLALAALQRRVPQLKITDDDTDVLRLSGQLPAVERPAIESLLTQYPQLASQIEWLPPAPEAMLVIEVRIAEVKRSFTRHVGIRWPGHINGPLIENKGNWLHLPLSAQATLDLMEREGHARLLANPTLTAMSGGKADFLVGGEFPVPQVLADGMQDVSFRPYGIQLEVAPKLLGNNYVSAALVAELSSIDPATSVNGVPGLLSRRVSSTLTLPLGETLVLSGLIQHEQAEQADRFPELHQIPIVGALFASKQFRSAQTDLVVMVTPRLAKLESEAQADLTSRAQVRKRFQQSAGCVGLIEPFVDVSVAGEW